MLYAAGCNWALANNSNPMPDWPTVTVAEVRMSGDIDTALRLIASHLGLDSPALAGVWEATRVTPTFAEYLTALRVALPTTTVHTYDPYWRIVENVWGNRCLDMSTPPEIQALVESHRRRAQVRFPSYRGGRTIEERLDGGEETQV